MSVCVCVVCIQVIKEKIENNSLSKMCTFKLLILPSPTWFPAVVILGKCFFTIVYIYCCRPFRKIHPVKMLITPTELQAIKSKRILIKNYWFSWSEKFYTFPKGTKKQNEPKRKKKLWLSTRRWNSLQLQSNWLKLKKPLWTKYHKSYRKILCHFHVVYVCLPIEKKKNWTKFEWQA